jgi:hypothetical protein
MKTSTLRPLNSAMGAQRLALLIACVLLGRSANAADAVLDFRTLIPGILDVPVYRADGTNRPSWVTGCMAILYVGSHPSSMFPLGAPMPFGTDDKAGYVWREDPVPVVIPGVQAGDRVWVKMRAWEPHQGVSIPEDQPPDRFRSESTPFSLVVSNTPTPLLELKSFAFEVPPLQMSRQGGEVVLRWSAGDGTVYYAVETTSALGVPGSWRASGLSPLLDARRWWEAWEAYWVVTNHPAPGNAWIAPRLTIGHQWPGVPEPLLRPGRTSEQHSRRRRPRSRTTPTWPIGTPSGG